MLVREKQKKARKEGCLTVRNRRESKREKEGKRDGVRPEGSDGRLSWFMFLCFVFPVILSPVLGFKTFTFCNDQEAVLLQFVTQVSIFYKLSV